MNKFLCHTWGPFVAPQCATAQWLKICFLVIWTVLRLPASRLFDFIFNHALHDKVHRILAVLKAPRFFSVPKLARELMTPLEDHRRLGTWRQASPYLQFPCLWKISGTPVCLYSTHRPCTTLYRPHQCPATTLKASQWLTVRPILLWWLTRKPERSSLPASHQSLRIRPFHNDICLGKTLLVNSGCLSASLV